MPKDIESIKQEKQFRSFRVEKSSVNAENRTVELSFSSETPVERWFGMEVLDHSKAACDLSRLNNGGALLVDHDPRDHVGVIESAEIDTKEKKGRAVVRFGKSQRANEVFQDVQDGIKQLVSVGYDIIEHRTEKGKANSPDTVVITRWQPLEVSLVSIPADPSVGVGRNHDKKDETHMNRLHLDPAPSPGGGGAAPATPAPTPTVNVEEITRNIRTKETERVKVIRSLAKIHNLADFGEEHVAAGTEADQFRHVLLEKIPNARVLTPAERNPSLGMTRDDIKRYSIVRAMNRMANKLPVDGFEKEISDEVAKRVKREASGFLIPSDIMNSEIPGLRSVQNRTLNINSQTAGGLLVGTEVGSMIELLRNKTVVASMGATTLSGLVGNLALPRQTGGATAYWLDETGQVTASDQSFGQLGLTPKRLVGLTKYTKQLLAQASIDVEGFVRNDLTTVLAIAKDKAAIQGAASAGEPVGILNTTGVNSVSFGGAPTWAKIVDFEKETDIDNALMGTIGYLSTPATRAKWKTTVKAANTAVYLLDGNEVNGYKFASTNQFPTSGTLNQVIFGNWADLILADWDGIDVVVDPYSLADTNIVRVVITIMTDIGVRHAVSFCISSDSGAQ
jgi:HK97 family phage major capsid protein/HK97 family phage prohead protease